MKVYIYEYVSGITNSWHNGGGLVIVTDRDPLDAYNALSDMPDRAEMPEPDSVIEAPGATERLHIFPDEGCC